MLVVKSRPEIAVYPPSEFEWDSSRGGTMLHFFLVESSLEVVRTTILLKTLAILLWLGCVYVFSVSFHYIRALKSHDKVKT